MKLGHTPGQAQQPAPGAPSPALVHLLAKLVPPTSWEKVMGSLLLLSFIKKIFRAF